MSFRGRRAIVILAVSLRRIRLRERYHFSVSVYIHMIVLRFPQESGPRCFRGAVLGFSPIDNYEPRRRQARHELPSRQTRPRVGRRGRVAISKYFLCLAS